MRTFCTFLALMLGFTLSAPSFSADSFMPPNEETSVQNDLCIKYKDELIAKFNSSGSLTSSYGKLLDVDHIHNESANHLLCKGTYNFANGTSNDMSFSFAPDELRKDQVSGNTPEDVIARSRVINTCTFIWQLGVQAKSLLTSGWDSSRVEDQLVYEYGYGSSGDESIAKAIHGVVASVSMSHAEREANDIPDYSSQAFLKSCPVGSPMKTRTIR